jgi:3-isopropylmalate/(R)-2-methylmalate dehydratase large subunit
VLEFVGDGARALSIDERMAVANMAVEAGAETGLFAADQLTREYLSGRVRRDWVGLRSDDDAEIAREVQIDLNTLAPLVAAPHSPGNVVALADAVGTPVEQVYIGNCANGTITDLRQAAAIFHGRSVHPRARAVIVPATQTIYRQALRDGLLDTFVEAGAMVSTPTCGACFGGGMGVPAAGETAVTTTNRNFRGRMGSPDARVYLANAYVAAAAAVAGELIDPGELIEAPAS